MSSKPKLVFFGTGQTSLDALQCLTEYFEVELIITKPPAKNSAGKLFKNQVQLWAEQNNVKLITPATKQELRTTVKKFGPKSQLAVVLDYGMIIPSEVIDQFELGILNSHFSLLPKYRGADPIRASILNGDEITGVTIIRITPGLDDGPILTWAEQEVSRLNAQELREKLSNINCALLPETIRLYINNELDPIEQDESQATHTKKVTKANGLLDSTKSATQLEHQVRAYAGWPKSFFEWQGKTYIIHKAEASRQKAEAGKLVVVEKRLYFGCKNGSLEIIEIQPANKLKMNAGAFINGYL